MAVNQCRYLILEYVGRYHAAFCRNTNLKLCPRRHNSMKCKVNISCFNLLGLRNAAVTQEINRGMYGDGEPTATAPTTDPVKTEPVKTDPEILKEILTAGAT